jgi:hypothetical protein
MFPTGGRTYVGAAVEAELSAVSDGFGEVFFNFMIGLNNHLIGTTEPFLAGAPAFIRTNGNPQVDAIMRWLIESAPNLLDFDWGRERYLRQTYGVIGAITEELNEGYEQHGSQQRRSSSEAEFARWWNLVTDVAHVELSTLQFAQMWVSAARAQRSSNSYAKLAEFFDNFHLPLLPPELNGKIC